MIAGYISRKSTMRAAKILSIVIGAVIVVIAAALLAAKLMVDPNAYKPRIAAAVKNRVAIEINAHFQIPSEKFIRRAKAAGARFSLPAPFPTTGSPATWCSSCTGPARARSSSPGICSLFPTSSNPG